MLIKAFPKAKSAGFTLIELMIALMVLVVLVGMGFPSFLQMLRNAEIRAAAESVANGLQRARAEAVSRNVKVQFILGAGTSWRVDLVPAAEPPIDSRESSEGSANTSISSSLAADSTAATTITFNQLGQIVPNADASKSLAQVNFVAPGGSQGLRVTIGAGGNARVCDPSYSAPHPRAC